MNIEQRLAKLERQNRWMKRAGGLALAAVACVVLMGQGKPKGLPDLVARSLILKDSTGTLRFSLRAQKGGGEMHIIGKDGSVQLSPGWLRLRGGKDEAILSPTQLNLTEVVSVFGPKVKSKRGQVLIGVWDDGPKLILYSGQKVIWKAPK